MMARVLQNVACNAVHNVEERCCRWILSMHDRLDRDTVPLTHEFLADMLGVQRSTVSSITRALQGSRFHQTGPGCDHRDWIVPAWRELLASVSARCAAASSGCSLTLTGTPRPRIHTSRVAVPDRPITLAVKSCDGSQPEATALPVILNRQKESEMSDQVYKVVDWWAHRRAASRMPPNGDQAWRPDVEISAMV